MPMQTSRLRTKRLELIAATREMVHADRYQRDRLPLLLEAALPAVWPPPLNDDASLTWVLNFITTHPEANGWSMWYFILNGHDQERVAIGNGGFRGAPAQDGTVEIGYSLVEAYQGHGLGTEATGRLIAWAFDSHAVRRIAAETYPHLRRSIRVLDKCGFSYIGQGSEQLTIRFELRREEWLQFTSPP